MWTVRRWAEMGHFGHVHRTGMNTMTVGSHDVLLFETRYADILGVGGAVMTVAQLCRRYGIAQRTFYNWKSKFQFPAPLKIPGSSFRKWRVSDVEQWEWHWRITPNTTIVT